MALIGDLLANVALFAPSDHSIGTFIPDVAIRESHRDAMVITQHPVEGGGVVSDHAFRRPAELELEYGFSNSTVGSEGYVQQQYAAMLKLKDSRQLQTIYTTKRVYQNMVVADVVTATDQRTQSALILLIRCQEMIIVSTQTMGTGTATTQPGASTTDGSGNTQTAQADPQSTSAITDRGTVATQGVGSQAFAGAFNPGAYSTDGASVGNGSFGLGGINPPTETIASNPNLTGLSPPATITLPEISVTMVPMIGGLQGAGPDQYNMFGGSP